MQTHFRRSSIFSNCYGYSRTNEKIKSKKRSITAECDWVVTKAAETGAAESDVGKYIDSFCDLPSTQTPVMENPALVWLVLQALPAKKTSQIKN